MLRQVCFYMVAGAIINWWKYYNKQIINKLY